MELSTDLQGNIDNILKLNINKYKKQDTIIKNLVENYYELIVKNIEKDNKYNNINSTNINKISSKIKNINVNINDCDVNSNNYIENPMDIIPDYEIPKKTKVIDTVCVDDEIRCNANEWAPLNCSQRCVRAVDKVNGSFCKIHLNYRPYGII